MTAGDLMAILQAAGLRLWTDADGGLLVAPREVLSDEQRALIRAHKAALVVALRTADRAEFMPDNRRTCRQCARLVRGRCMAAANSAIALAREYRPDPGIPRRCEEYEPGPLDTDCRPVPIRWPGLALPPEGHARSRHD